MWLWGRFGWRFLCLGCPCSRQRILFHHCLPRLFANKPGSHHHSLVCTGFSFCILIWKADWCTKGIDRIYFLFCIFLMVLEECPKYKTCLYFLLIFWLWNHFLQVPELKGWDRTSCSSLSEWIPVTWSESKTRTLLWKGKLICYLIVPSCSSWILQKLFFRAWEQTNC